MTNEEAIRILREYQYGGGDGLTHFGTHSFDLNDETVEHIISALSRDRWISVEERLPEKNGLYIVYLLAPVDEYREELSYATEMRFYEDEKLWVDDTESYNALLPPSDDRYCVTHWKKMPEPPKEET